MAAPWFPRGWDFGSGRGGSRGGGRGGRGGGFGGRDLGILNRPPPAWAFLPDMPATDNRFTPEDGAPVGGFGEKRYVLVGKPREVAPAPVRKRTLVANTRTRAASAAAAAAATVRHFEDASRLKWSAKLVAMVPKDAPVWEQASDTGDAEGFMNMQFGDRSFGVLRKHAGNVEKYIFWAKLAGLSPFPAAVSSVWGYLQHLKGDEIGASTLQAACASIDWFSHRIGLTSGARAPACASLAKTWAIQHRAETVEAEPYDVDEINAIERGICCENFSPELRIVLFLIRFGIGTSTRFGDRQHSKPLAMNIVEGHLVGKSWSGKTGARAFACAATATDRALTGWLGVGLRLYLTHPSLNYVRDYLIPHVVISNHVIVGFFPRPASHSNYAHAARHALIDCGVPPEAALRRTPHSEKSTLIHYAVHMGESTRPMLIQGAWKSKDENMPLKYSRKLHSISLALTLRIFRRIRRGWRPPFAESVAVQKYLDMPPTTPRASLILKDAIKAKIKSKKSVHFMGKSVMAGDTTPPEPCNKGNEEDLKFDIDPAAAWEKMEAVLGNLDSEGKTSLEPAATVDFIDESVNLPGSSGGPRPPAVAANTTHSRQPDSKSGGVREFTSAETRSGAPLTLEAEGFVRNTATGRLHVIVANAAAEPRTGCCLTRAAWVSWRSGAEFLDEFPVPFGGRLCRHPGCFGRQAHE